MGLVVGGHHGQRLTETLLSVAGLSQHHQSLRCRVACSLRDHDGCPMRRPAAEGLGRAVLLGIELVVSFGPSGSHSGVCAWGRGLNRRKLWVSPGSGV